MLKSGTFSTVYQPTTSSKSEEFRFHFKSPAEEILCQIQESVQTESSIKKPVSQDLKISLEEPKMTKTRVSSDNDLYVNVDAVFLIFDPRKQWTLDYVIKELKLVPPKTAVLVLSNFRDCSDCNSELIEQARNVCRSSKRVVRFLEVSCANAYGKMQVFTFLNIPFLKKQEEHLKLLVERNTEDQLLATEEFEMVSTEQNYSNHLKWADDSISILKKAPIEAPKEAKKQSIVTPTKPNAMGEKSVATSTSSAVMELEEDLDGFLENDDLENALEKDGWGATIESSEDSQEVDEEVRQPNSNSSLPFTPLEVKKENSAEKPVLQIRKSHESLVLEEPLEDSGKLDDDNLDDFLEAQIDEEAMNEKIETIISEEKPVTNTAVSVAKNEEEKPDVNLAAILENATKFAAESAAEKPVEEEPKKKKSGGKKKRKGGKKNSASVAGPATSTRDASEYQSL